MTRFYLPASGSAPVSPAYATASWTNSASAARLPLVSAKTGTALSNMTLPEVASSAHQLARQFVGPTMDAQIISGTVQGQIKVREGNAAVNAFSQAVIRVCDSAGTTFRGTLVSLDTTGGTEWVSTTSLTGRNFPRDGVVAITSLSCQANDRIVVEVGAHIGVGGEAATSLNFGDVVSASDLTSDQADTGTDNPWMEFSATIVFAGAGGGSTVPVMYMHYMKQFQG